MQSSHSSCQSTAASLRALVEQSICDAAPDVTGIDWDEPAGSAEPAQLLQVGLLSRNGSTPEAAEQPALVESGTH
jgi:hypothetical protein